MRLPLRGKKWPALDCLTNLPSDLFSPITRHSSQKEAPQAQSRNSGSQLFSFVYSPRN
uniref:Uncharacterized protein n=1 Tax=Picea glauca TaxID=3330 RepID=A0A101LY50_PICGL|nr:hypothetical protein ABT39_MTgene5710 [Picea glauca]